MEQTREALVKLIYRTLGEPDGWRQFLGALGKAMRASQTLLFVIYPQRPGMSVTTVTGATVEDRHLWETRWAPHDPWMARVNPLSMPTGIVRPSHHTISDEDLEATEIYREFLGPRGWHYGGGVPLVAAPHQVALHSMVRPKDIGPLTDDEVAFWMSLVPHLTTAVRLHDERTRLEAEHAAAMSLLDAHDEGLLLVNEQGKVLLANHAGREMLAERRFVEERDGFLAPVAGEPSQPETLHLLEAVGKLGLPMAPMDGVTRLRVLLADRQGSIAAASLRRLNTPSGQTAAGPLHGGPMVTTPTVAITIADPSRRPRLDPGTLRDLYGLTEAEARVAMQLAEDFTIDEIAALDGKSVETIRTQLKRIFMKTGCERQSELVGLVLRTARAKD